MTEPPVQLSQQQFEELLGRLANGNPTDGGAGSTRSSVKPERPKIDIDTTEGEWGVFDDNWSRFKRMAKLTAIEDIRDNLRQCCSAQLNKRLFDIKGAATLNAASEADLLSWIKDIAVQGVHKEVHRTQFVHCKQKQGERVGVFHGRLKAEAKLCDFRVPAPGNCSNDACVCENHGMQVSYQDDMIATQLVAGLYNSEHQVKVLSESSTLVSLEEKLNRLVVLEKSDSSLSSLGNSDAFVNMSTGGDKQKGGGGYKKRWQKKDKQEQTSETTNDNCPDCGKKHSPCRTCKGFHKCTTRCNHCKKMGHIKNCCQKFLQLSVRAAHLKVEDVGEEEEEVVFSYSVTMATFSISVHQISKYLLSHMECKDGSFQTAKPAKAPLIQVTCRLLVEHHVIYGRILRNRKKRCVKAEGLADTGAQVCTAGPSLLSYFHIDESFLIPTKLEVKGISHFSVTMMGALFLEVSANGIYTKQIVYIAREARSLILSETALKDLGVIPSNFPTAGTFDTLPSQVPHDATIADREVQLSVVDEATVARCVVMNHCGCPVRTEVPPIPTNIPFEKPEVN